MLSHTRWRVNKLMLNTDKTEAMIVGTASRVGQIETGSIPILDSGISFQSSVKYLECSS